MKVFNNRIAGSLDDVFRIAQMFRSHLVVYEQFIDEENSERRCEFEALDITLLIPRTWQEMIVTYADLNSNGGRRISIQDKIMNL